MSLLDEVAMVLHGLLDEVAMVMHGLLVGQWDNAVSCNCACDVIVLCWFCF